MLSYGKVLYYKDKLNKKDLIGQNEFVYYISWFFVSFDIRIRPFFKSVSNGFVVNNIDILLKENTKEKLSMTPVKRG